MRSPLQRSELMKFTFGIKICLMRFFGCCKTSNMFLLTVYFYTCLKRFSAIKDTNAKKSAFIIFFRALKILIVFRLRGFAKIFKRIITWIPIDMINAEFRKNSRHIQPNQAVHQIIRTINAYLPITAFFSSVPGNISWRNPVCWRYSPSQKTNVRIIVNKFTQTFCSKIGFSHDAISPLIGERPARDFYSRAGLAIIHDARNA